MGSFFGNRELLFPLSVMMAASVLGVLATFSLRQLPHLMRNKKDFLLLPHFVVIVTIAQFIRVWAFYTPWRIGTWGTRASVDEERTEEVFLTEIK
jgi:hypothetical protein